MEENQWKCKKCSQHSMGSMQMEGHKQVERGIEGERQETINVLVIPDGPPGFNLTQDFRDPNGKINNLINNFNWRFPPVILKLFSALMGNGKWCWAVETMGAVCCSFMGRMIHRQWADGIS
jgi:hypothetical protein